MRYIRLLKPPRIAVDKATQRHDVLCLATITSDLGDSFLPYHVQLCAELLLADGHVLVWRTLQWTSGMRTLPIALPLPKSHALSSPLRLRIAAEPKNQHDDYAELAGKDARGVVSAWSPPFAVNSAPERLVERRFKLSDDATVSIWEETGESIARHLWDAGITLACQVADVKDANKHLSSALFPSKTTSPNILELGTGCGIVGIALAQTLSHASVLLTDLPEAREIVQRNIDQASVAEGASLKFLELDWDAPLPRQLQNPSSPLHLILAADCTYNSDSSPALVTTLSRLTTTSPAATIAIAMKMRHSSEQVFFHLMTTAGFVETARLDFLLPGDVQLGEETVHLHVYRMDPVR